MKNSVSDQNFYMIESDKEDEVHEEEDDHEKQQSGDDEDGSDSDSSYSSNERENDHQSKPLSINPSWPQSYRQSIDLYSSVASPNLTFLGTPNLPRLGSSFLSSSLSFVKPSSELFPALSKPLLPQAIDEQQPQERRSSYSLLPPLPSKKSSVIKSGFFEQKPSSILLDEIADHSRKSSYGQTVLNGMNALCGVGILSTPYAVKEGGFAGLVILVVFAIMSYYTGILLRTCLDSKPGLETYPDIGQAAFGRVGRIAISIILYVELYACCVEYIILEGDNLSSLFPNAHLRIGGLELNSKDLFALITALTVLPTVWLRDLSILSYISAGGVIASLMVVMSLFWVGFVDRIGFHSEPNTLNLSTLPVAIGLYGFCYSGHGVLPNIYSSMKKPSQYPSVLFTSFGICTVLYAGVAVMGYLMFGESTKSQYTLNLPKDLVASKLAVWTTVVNPFTKYALTMTPVAMCLEELIPASQAKSQMYYSIFIRTTLVLSTLVVGLTIPFFGLVMALIGSLLTMLVAFILPCACYLCILRGKVSSLQIFACLLVIVVGVVASIFGTYSAFSKIIQSL